MLTVCVGEGGGVLFMATPQSACVAVVQNHMHELKGAHSSRLRS